MQREWREVVGPLPEAKSLAISAELISFGAPVHMSSSRTRIPTASPRSATRWLARLREFAGVFDVQADQEEGLREIQLDLLPEARTLGAHARQPGQAGALRVLRRRGPAGAARPGEMRVYVRLPEEERNAISDVEGYLVRVRRAVARCRWDRVASVRFGSSPTTIQRKDGSGVLTVTADVNTAVVTGRRSHQPAGPLDPPRTRQPPTRG